MLAFALSRRRIDRDRGCTLRRVERRRIEACRLDVDTDATVFAESIAKTAVPIALRAKLQRSIGAFALTPTTARRSLSRPYAQDAFGDIVTLRRPRASVTSAPEACSGLPGVASRLADALVLPRVRYTTLRCAGAVLLSGSWRDAEVAHRRWFDRTSEPAQDSFPARD